MHPRRPWAARPRVPALAPPLRPPAWPALPNFLPCDVARGRQHQPARRRAGARTSPRKSPAARAKAARQPHNSKHARHTKPETAAGCEVPTVACGGGRLASSLNIAPRAKTAAGRQARGDSRVPRLCSRARTLPVASEMMRAVLVLSALAAAAAQEVPIPSAPDGFRYNVTSNRTAPVQIEGYFDLMCPDTRVRAGAMSCWLRLPGWACSGSALRRAPCRRMFDPAVLPPLPRISLRFDVALIPP